MQRDSNTLEVDKISVDFQGLRAIDEVSFRLAPGEILGLIGPNGAGKTTLINVLSGFQQATEGRVLLNKSDLGPLLPHQRSRLGLVRTFQGILTFGGLTVIENVEAGGVGIGLSRRDAHTAAEQILTTLGLVAQAERRVSTLPFGQERRVGIARALAMRPKFLLMDEPAAGMNDAECDDLAIMLKGLVSEHGCGVLFVEHRMSLIFDLCDRVHVLEQGRTIAEGTADAIRTDPIVRAAYLGEETV